MKIVPALLSSFLFAATAALLSAQDTTVPRPDCSIDAGPCVVKAAGGKIEATFTINPKPVTAMRELSFSLRLTDNGKPISSAAVTIELSMPGMYMGKNRITMAGRGNGLYEGTGTFVRCPSGGKLWQAVVNIQTGNASSTATYLFEVH